MTYKKFNILAISWMMGLLLLAGALNLVIDPLSRIWISPGGPYFSSEREFKELLWKKGDWNALLLGSSRPANIDTQKLNPLVPRFFNGAFSNAVPEEIFEFLKPKIKNISAVVLSLDFYMLNENTYPLRKEIESEASLSQLKYLMSFDTLLYSFQHLGKLLMGAPRTILDYGQRNTVLKDEQNRKTSGYDYANTLRHLFLTDYHDFQYSEARLRSLEAIRDLCKAHQVPLYVFVNPTNEEVIKNMQTVGLESLEKKFATDLQKVFGRVWTFDPEFSAKDLYYRFDPAHYTPDTGERLLLKIIQDVGSSFLGERNK